MHTSKLILTDPATTAARCDSEICRPIVLYQSGDGSAPASVEGLTRQSLLPVIDTDHGDGDRAKRREVLLNVTAAAGGTVVVS